MTIITFEFNPALAETKTKIQLNQGFHKGMIVSTEIITNVRPQDETQFCVTWQIGDNTFMDKFKLWAIEEKKRTYAQAKLSNLCKAVGITLFSKQDDKNINFDTSALVDKQCNLLISEFETIRGDKVVFINNTNRSSQRIDFLIKKYRLTTNRLRINRKSKRQGIGYMSFRDCPSH